MLSCLIMNTIIICWKQRRENSFFFWFTSGTKKTWLDVFPDCYNVRTLPAYTPGDGRKCKCDRKENSGCPILDKLPSPQKHFQMMSLSWFVITQRVWLQCEIFQIIKHSRCTKWSPFPIDNPCIKCLTVVTLISYVRSPHHHQCNIG